MGAGKFGMDDIYKSWVHYCKHWKNCGRPKLYFVKTDITNCYDSILQDKLYSILENAFQQVRNKNAIFTFLGVLVETVSLSTNNMYFGCVVREINQNKDNSAG